MYNVHVARLTQSTCTVITGWTGYTESITYCLWKPYNQTKRHSTMYRISLDGIKPRPLTIHHMYICYCHEIIVFQTPFAPRDLFLCLSRSFVVLSLSLQVADGAHVSKPAWET